MRWHLKEKYEHAHNPNIKGRTEKPQVIAINDTQDLLRSSNSMTHIKRCEGKKNKADKF